MIRIFTDWNAREDARGRFEGGFVPLTCLGSYVDIRRQNVELQEGLHIIVYDEELQAEAVLEKYQGDWWARLVGTITEIPEGERTIPDPNYQPSVSDSARPKGETTIRIWSDFGALNGNLIPLDFDRSLEDIRRQKVELREGLHIIVYVQAIQAEAVVENHRGRWYGYLVDRITVILKDQRRIPASQNPMD
jgi:hypothetical protein